MGTHIYNNDKVDIENKEEGKHKQKGCKIVKTNNVTIHLKQLEKEEMKHPRVFFWAPKSL